MGQQPRQTGGDCLPDPVSPQDPLRALEETKATTAQMSPDFRFGPVASVFSDVAKLFAGQWPGYRACNTLYHDLKHTTDALLAMARLLDGALLQGVAVPHDRIRLGLICALLHDTGYIQRTGDRAGTGARYTLTHVDRSARFAREYLPQAGFGFTKQDLRDCRDILNCTGLYTKVASIRFRSPEAELMGKILGTADLLGQMSDRAYLEKLLFLYYEFREGGIPGYESELDLLRKTVAFYKAMRQRLSGELGGVSRYMVHHFEARWNTNRNPYQEAIQKNRAYLLHILHHHVEAHRIHLRRSGVVRRLTEKGL